LNVILDASSTINLHRADLLPVILRLTSIAFHVGYIVREECEGIKRFIDIQVSAGTLVLVPDSTLTARKFAEILGLYDLGLGETECIALAEQQGFLICTDDKAARKAATRHLGSERVLGSLRLLRECVCQGLLAPGKAFVAYEAMKAAGAFLPSVPANYFDC
jgi:predicted nucleic acid-binding protein